MVVFTPLVTVYWFEGRTVEQKKKLSEAITKAFTDIAKVSREDVIVVYIDLPRENVAKAGILASDKPQRT